MSFFPSKYYLASRYDSSVSSFLVYILKYWGSIALFYIIYFDNGNISFDNLLFCLFSLAVYFSVYDYFCFINDQEPGALTVRKGGVVSKWSVVIQVISISAVGLYIYKSDFLFPILVCLLISVVFYIHNSIPEKARVISYFLLYFLKPFLFFQSFFSLMPVVFFSLFYALSYVPYYFVKKFGLEWPSKMTKFLFSGISLKVVFLLIFLPLNFNLIYLLVWQLLFTVVDFLNKNRCF